MKTTPYSFIFIVLTLLCLSCKKDLERDNYHDLNGSNFQDIIIVNSEIVVGGHPSSSSQKAISLGEFYTVLTLKNGGTKPLNGISILIKDGDGKVIREYDNIVGTILPGQEVKLSKAIKVPVRNGSTIITFTDAEERIWDKPITYNIIYPNSDLRINEMDLIYESNPDGKINPGETVRYKLMLYSLFQYESWDIKSIGYNELSPYITSAYLSSGFLPYTH